MTMVDIASKKLFKRVGLASLFLIVFSAIVSLTALIYTSVAGVVFLSVKGNSMSPTFEHNSTLIVKQSPTLVRDELVFFNKPQSWINDEDPRASKRLVKRIAAVPGDVLTFDGDVFSVNGKAVYETRKNNYTCEDAPSEYERTLKSGEVFVLGDNAHESIDSRRIFCDGKEGFLVTSAQISTQGVPLRVF